MMKKFAIIIAILMVIVALWGLFIEKDLITILINGQEVSGPGRQRKCDWFACACVGSIPQCLAGPHGHQKQQRRAAITGFLGGS